MRGYRFADSGPQNQFLEHFPDGDSGERFSGPPAEDQIRSLLGFVGRSRIQFLEGIGGKISQRSQTLLAPFSLYPNESGLELDIAPLQPQQFADTQAATVEHLEDGPISGCQRLIVFDGLEDHLDFTR